MASERASGWDKTGTADGVTRRRVLWPLEHMSLSISIIPSVLSSVIRDNKLLEGTEAVTSDASGSNAIRGLDGSGRSALLLLRIIMIFDI